MAIAGNSCLYLQLLQGTLIFTLASHWKKQQINHIMTCHQMLHIKLKDISWHLITSGWWHGKWDISWQMMTFGDTLWHMIIFHDKTYLSWYVMTFHEMTPSDTVRKYLTLSSFLLLFPSCGPERLQYPPVSLVVLDKHGSVTTSCIYMRGLGTSTTKLTIQKN